MVNIKARTKSFFGQIPKKLRQVKFLLLTLTRALIVTLVHTRRRRRKAKQYLALYSKYFFMQYVRTYLCSQKAICSLILFVSLCFLFLASLRVKGLLWRLLLSLEGSVKSSGNKT